MMQYKILYRPLYEQFFVVLVEKTTKKPNQGLIIGLSVGGALLLLIIIIFVIVCCAKHNKSQEPEKAKAARRSSECCVIVHTATFFTKGVSTIHR